MRLTSEFRSWTTIMPPSALTCTRLVLRAWFASSLVFDRRRAHNIHWALLINFHQQIETCAFVIQHDDELALSPTRVIL